MSIRGLRTRCKAPLSHLIVCLLVSSLLQMIPFSNAVADYAWPLQENFGISGTFGEFRENHFHAGLDLSTNGETGLPVLAVDDGMVYRLKVQKRGYGRAVYIQHPDGMVSVYAHLDSFSSELGLEQIYQQKIAETGNRYLGDIFLEPAIAVRKGDVIAYSGESGVGLPHLHLELRKTEAIAVNPLLHGFQDTLDPIPPIFQACYFYPLTSEAAVDSSLETRQLRLQKDGLYYVPDHTPIVRGDFITSVSVYDSALRPYHRAPRKLSFSIDNRTVYSVDFTELSYTEPPGFGIVYDLGKPGPSYYEHPVLLTKLSDGASPFLSEWVPLSTKGLSPGLHQLQIEARDANDNTSLAHIDFIVNTPPGILIENVRADQEDLAVTVEITDPDWRKSGIGSLAGEVEYSIDKGRSFVSFPVTTLHLDPTKQSARFSYRVPLAQIRTASPAIIKARGFDGVEHSPYSVVAVALDPEPRMELPQKPPQGTVHAIPYSNSVKVVFDTEELLTYPLLVQAGDPPVTYKMESWDLTSYQAVIPAPRVTGSLSLLLPGNQQISMPIHFQQRGTMGSVQGENYELLFEPDTLFWDTFVWTKSLPAYAARYLPLIGPMLQLAPRGVPLKKDATLSFHYPSDMAHPERLSIYAWDRAKQKWTSLVSRVDTDSKVVRAKIGVFDLYALIYDNVAPVITPIFPKRYSSTSNQTPKLAVGIRDSGMDVDDEKVTFFVDGVPYTAEYDPDRNVATAKIDRVLRRGYHKFWVVAYDYAGNKAESQKITFRIR